MLIAVQYLTDAVKRLNNILSGLKRKNSVADFGRVRDNAAECFADAINSAEELSLMAEKSLTGVNIFLRVLRSVWEEAAQAGTKDKLVEKLEEVLSIWSDDIENEVRSFEEWDICYSCRRLLNSPLLPDEVLMNIGRKINPLEREIRILDLDMVSRYDSNLSITAISAGYRGMAELYGVDQKDILSSAHRKDLSRVAKGDLRGSFISNNAFEVVYLCPRCSYKAEDKTIIRHEVKMLYKAMDLMQTGGLLIFAVPVTHLYREICSILATKFRDVRIGRHGSFAVITATKKESQGLFPEDNRSVYEKLRFFGIRCSEEETQEEFENISLTSTKEIPVKYFRGSIIDDSELEILLESSKAVKDFWDEQKVEKQTENGRRPLLPFNVGQLGLILTSGCLDGIVEEDEYSAHAVKGRIIKKQEQVTDVNEAGRQLTVSVTTSNRVEINAFLPDGTYLNLV